MILFQTMLREYRSLTKGQNCLSILNKVKILMTSYCFKKHTPHWMMKKQILAVLQPNFGGKNSFDLIDQKSDENEQIIITEAKMNDHYFIVIKYL